MRRTFVEETGLLHLLAVMESLKETGCEIADSRQIWCKEWARANEDEGVSTDSKAQIAKSTLTKMLSTKKALDALCSSFEEAFQLVSGQITDIVQPSNFSSLPVDLLAHIFTLAHHHALNNVKKRTGLPAVSVSNVLVQVCRRFRDVALRIPSLWQDISNYHREGWIINLKIRCVKPVVFITYDVPKPKSSIANLLRHARPASQWKGLDVRCFNRNQAHDFFIRFSKASDGGLFRSLESLSILSDWDRRESQIDSSGQRSDIDDEYDGFDLRGNLSSADADLLSRWKLPEVKTIKLQNIIPPRLDLPSLQMCHLELSSRTNVFHWSFKLLKDFLRCVRLVESLTLVLWDAIAIEDEVLQEPIKFSRLESLTMSVGATTRESDLAGIMDAMDVATVTELKITMGIYLFSMDGDFRLKHDMPMKWLEAIFTRRRRPNEMIGGGETRTFPNVVKLHLELTEEGQYIPYEKVFKAVPQVRDLTLELPNCDAPSTHHELDTGERLTDVRFANCNSFSGEEVLDFFKTRSKDEEPWFENLQRFEIENCEGLRDSKNEFENLFGDALVWKA